MTAKRLGPASFGPSHSSTCDGPVVAAAMNLARAMQSFHGVLARRVPVHDEFSPPDRPERHLPFNRKEKLHP